MGQLDGISARALAPLSQLVEWSRQHLKKGVVGAFLKGEDWQSELTALEPIDSLASKVIVSRTTPHARLIALGGPSPAS
jgi:16S rRNA (guanine527-N7)-methyltransferase